MSFVGQSRASTYVRNESASHPIAPELLGVAGYSQNDRNNLIGYGSNHMRYDAEIEAHLRTDHRQDEKNAYQDHHPVWFQPSQWGGERVRKQPNGNPSAIERRQWHQIEDRQNNVDDQRILQVFSNPLRSSVWQVADEVEQQCGEHGEHNINARACRRNPYHVAPRIAQRPEVDRDRLRIAKQERRAQESSNAGSKIVPVRSMCLSGLNVTRPSREAVSSPSRSAAKPCAASWNVIAMMAGRAQIEIA